MPHWTRPHRPPCPGCGSRMWFNNRNMPILRCPHCHRALRLDSPVLYLHPASHLAELRRKMDAVI